jgi:argininosuccinate lyase
LSGGYDAEAMSEIVEQDLAEFTKGASSLTRKDILKALSAANFVAVRCITGGPAGEALDPEITRAREQISLDQQWLAATREALASARALRRQECDALIQRTQGS